MYPGGSLQTYRTLLTEVTQAQALYDSCPSLACQNKHGLGAQVLAVEHTQPNEVKGQT